MSKQPANKLLENERALLGSWIDKPEKTEEEIANLNITLEWFDHPECKTMFEAIKRLTDKGEPVDAITVHTESGLHSKTVQEFLDIQCVAGHQNHYALPLQARYIQRQATRLLNDAKGNPTALLHAIEQITALLPQRDSTATALTASEWLQQQDEPTSELVSGLIDQGGRVAIVGQSKARKSFLALQLAIALATGKPFLGYQTTAQRVLLLNGEITGSHYKKRVRRMIEALAINPSELSGLRIANTSEDATPWDLARILTMAKSLKVSAVIVDPAYLLLEDEIDQQEVRRCVREMKRFAQIGITLLMIYHATKGRIGDRQVIDRVAGSGIFARDCSTLVSLCEHANEADHVVMSCEVRNHPPQPPKTILFDNGAFHLADEVAPIEKTSTTKTARKFDLEAVARSITGRMTYKDVVESIRSAQGVGRNKAVELVGQLVTGGLVETETVGRCTFYQRRETV